MESADPWVWAVLFAVMLVIVMFMVSVAGRANHKRLKRNVYHQHGDLSELREQLLAYVVKLSHNRRTDVPLAPFWRKKKIKMTVRYVLLEPLLEEGHLYLPEKKDPPQKSTADKDAFTEVLEGLWEMVVEVSQAIGQGLRYAVCIPSSTVRLSDRDWELMVHENVSPHVVIGYLEHRVENYNAGGDINKPGRDINNVGRDMNTVAAGRDVRDSTQKVSNIDKRQQTAALRELQMALLEDAMRVPEPDAREVRVLATQLDNALSSDEGVNDERIPSVLGRIRYTVNVLGDMMSSTARILQSSNELGIG